MCVCVCVLFSVCVCVCVCARKMIFHLLKGETSSSIYADWVNGKLI